MLLILLLLWGGLVCYWIVGLPATVLWERRLPDRRSLLHWLVIPAAVAVLAALWYTGASLYARFQLSRPAMDDLAMTVLDAPRQSDFDSKRVGLYWARNIERVGGVVRFQVAGSGFGNNTGFAYSPTQEPPNLGEDTYEHLYGPWWLWEESW
jgi:hypothetical protein